MNPVSKIMLGIGAAVALIIAAAFVWLSLANAHLKTQFAQAQANNTACHMANDEFAAQAARQNKAVEALQTLAAARRKRAQAAFRQAQKDARRYLAEARNLSARQSRGDVCKAAEALMDAYIGGKL